MSEIIQSIVKIAGLIHAQELRNARDAHLGPAVSVGFPIGTVLYAYDIDDGLTELIVVGAYKLCDGDAVLLCRSHHKLSIAVSPEEATLLAAKQWSSRSGAIEEIKQEIKELEGKQRFLEMCLSVATESSTVA